VEAYTYRWNSHVGPEDDGSNHYRPASEMQFWKDNCPIALLAEKLESAGYLNAELRARMEREIAGEMAANFKFAKQSAFPSETNWHSLNYEDASPLADKLLGTQPLSDFDHGQAEAKLQPY
jgi:TPP-dependent pyruvate/acetoin dehydrogenase alpha subunit